MANKPNFFIVGAPKCGTTSLARYLAGHPDIFFCDPKEPLFFGSDLDHKWKKYDLNQYLSLFDSATGEKRIGEGTVWYLYSKKAAEEIKAFEPNAKIIAMLRDPVGLISSLHREHLNSGNENIRNANAALAAETARRAGQNIPPGANFPGGLQYTDVVRFTDQIKRYFDAFGCDRVHVILYDDLKRDTETVYRGVLRFLEIDDGFTPDFVIHNQGSQQREIVSPAVNKLLNGPPELLDRAYSLIPKPVRSYGRALISRLNNPKIQRVDLSPNMAARVKASLREEFARLSDLIERDVTAWTD